MHNLLTLLNYAGAACYFALGVANAWCAVGSARVAAECRIQASQGDWARMTHLARRSDEINRRAVHGLLWCTLWWALLLVVALW